MTKILLLLTAVALVCVTGCTSTTLVQEIDPATGRVVKITETSESIAKSVMESTKEKSVIMWSSGWMAKIKAVFSNPESSAMPDLEISAGKVDTGMATIHRDQQNLDKVPDIIRATRSDLTVSANGVQENSKTGLPSAADTVTATGTANAALAKIKADKAATSTVVVDGITQIVTPETVNSTVTTSTGNTVVINPQK